MLDATQLAQIDMLADLTETQRKTIAPLGSVVSFDRGESIFRQDAPATHVYGLLEGRVELTLLFEERLLRHSIEYEEALTVEHEVVEKPIVVETLGPGELFGWSSLVSPPGLLTASAWCRQPCRTIQIPARELLDLFERDPRLGYLFMGRLVGVVSSRLRHRTEKLTEAWAEAFSAPPA